MDLKHLNAFLVVSHTRNFTRAAEYLNYAQSNVTTQIQQLEEELDVKLFDRIGKGICLTPEGERLIPYAKKMLSLSDEIKHLYLNTKDSGRIVIGASESLSIYKLPQILNQYKKEFPDVDIFIKVVGTPDFIPALANNEIDIALAIEPLMQDKSISCVFRKREPVCLFALPSHPLAAQKDIRPTDLMDMPLILTGPDCCYRKLFERNLLAHNIQPKIILATGSVPVIKMSTLAGLGACVIPALVVQKELENKELVRLDYDIDCPVYAQLLHHKDKWISPSLQAFIEITTQYYQTVAAP
ncbi:MAG: LysR family transcriptional regulator [Lachnospiraceae bacterium]|nr:LysR family transcriptional regulator [Lachnospiraceae bacterium]